MHYSFLEKYSLPFRKLFSLRSTMLYFSQNTRFPHHMQCLISIQYCCGFLEKGRLSLKESAAYRLQSALKTRYSLKKKQYSCKKILNVERWTTPWKSSAFLSSFLYDHCLRKKSTSSISSSCLEDQYFCRKIHDVDGCKASFKEGQPPSHSFFCIAFVFTGKITSLE